MRSPRDLVTGVQSLVYTLSYTARGRMSRYSSGPFDDVEAQANLSAERKTHKDSLRIPLLIPNEVPELIDGYRSQFQL